ncbi:MAG: hypothetical protein HUU34_10040 [Saprospiraceae bacterium]|jgi:hypothetical protein|nr:hypothetical protein [Saprospiraceae bacterium]
MLNISKIAAAVLIISLLILGFSGCQGHAHGDHAQLGLNNGAKWKADSGTNAHVTALLQIAQANNPQTLADYQNAGNTFQNELNNLIKDCRMQGPDHDALHQWLEPLLASNKKLMEAENQDAASAIFNEQKEHIQLYFTYFE